MKNDMTNTKLENGFTKMKFFTLLEMTKVKKIDKASKIMSCECRCIIYKIEYAKIKSRLEMLIHSDFKLRNE